MTIILLIAIIAISFAFIIVSKKAPKGVTNIDYKGIEALKSTNKVQLIDVRTTAEYKGKAIKGFINIPLDQLNKQIKTLDAQIPTVVMCASGMRSKQAAQIMVQNGFTSVYNFSGGISTYPQ